LQHLTPNFPSFYAVAIEEENRLSPKVKQFKTTLGLTILGGVFAGLPAYGLTCGQQVSGVVTLNDDLKCTNSDGLIVAGPNTVINLNNHVISCTGNGFENSCQWIQSRALPTTYAGIKSIGYDNVSVNGPGVITGFTIGVDFQNAWSMNVLAVEIEGPTTPPYDQDTRIGAVGVLVSGTSCPAPWERNPGPSFTIAHNFIANQVTGVSLQSVGCGVVANNQVYFNHRGGNMSSWGIDLLNAKNVTVNQNTAMYNGNGVAAGGGIRLASGTTGVEVTSNLVWLNCGHGIYAENVSGNFFHKNTGEADGTNNFQDQNLKPCVIMPAGMFFDLAESGSTNNVWSLDNMYFTKTPNIP
jgi:hypothetical protein